MEGARFRSGQAPAGPKASETTRAWRPLPAQERALRSDAYELLYGGAAGGGKTDFLLVAPLRWIGDGAFRALLLRRSFPELERTLIARSRELYPRLGGVYHETRHEWTFPSGAIVAFGYCETDADALRYQGTEWCFIGFDELTHFSESQYRYLTSRARSSAGLPIRIRSTSNPGGPGHEWVKARWAAWLEKPRKDRPSKVRPALPCELRWYDPDGHEVDEGTEWALSRTFVAATLADNPFLGREYRAQLMALDPVTRAQLLSGDWDVMPGEGKYFATEDWAYLDEVPPFHLWRAAIRAWDFGGSLKGDPWAGVLLVHAPSLARPWVVADVQWFRATPGDGERRVLATAQMDGPDVGVCIPQDPGQAGVAQVEQYARLLAGYRLRSRRPTGEKVLRASPHSAQVTHRQFALVRGVWTPGYVGEHFAFPDGPHDDQVDATSDAFAELAGRAPAEAAWWEELFRAEKATPRADGARPWGRRGGDGDRDDDDGGDDGFGFGVTRRG